MFRSILTMIFYFSIMNKSEEDPLCLPLKGEEKMFNGQCSMFNKNK